MKVTFLQFAGSIGLPLTPAQAALAAVSFDGAPVPADYADLMDQVSRRPELIPSGRYRDWVGGDTQIFEVRRKK